MDYAQLGSKALTDSDFPAAVEYYTKALTINPHATDYYIKRSTAYSRLKPADGGSKPEAALQDAEMAVAIGIQRARLEQIVTGQLRRAIVLYQQERFGDAQHIFQLVREKLGFAEKPNLQGGLGSVLDIQGGNSGSSEKKQKQHELQIWEMKVKSQLAKIDPSDEKAKVTVKDVPDIVVPTLEESRNIHRSQLQGAVAATNPTHQVSSAGQEKKNSEQPTSQATGVPQAPVSNKVRHEWYQSNDNVVVTLYAKGVPKDKAVFDIQENSLSISFPTATGSEFSFNLDPLYAAINPSSSKYNVMSTKLEVNLRKQNSGQKWAALEGTSTPANKNDIPRENIKKDPVTLASPVISDKPPTYPTSSKSGVKDWDKVASNLSKKEKKKEKLKEKSDEANSKEGENEEDDVDSDMSDSGDAVDSFFKKLYAKSDPDTRRAMVKSFYESDGTALNTNWNEVEKERVKVHPPSAD